MGSADEGTPGQDSITGVPRATPQGNIPDLESIVRCRGPCCSGVGDADDLGHTSITFIEAVAPVVGWHEVQVDGEGPCSEKALASERHGGSGHDKDGGDGRLRVSALAALKKENIMLRSVQCPLKAGHEDPHPTWHCLKTLPPPAAEGDPVLKIRLRMELEGWQHDKGAKSTAQTDLSKVRALLGKVWDPDS